jgi:hypothetical protein
MSAIFALESAEAVGVRVVVDGDDLAPEQPPQAVLDLLSQHKAEILRMLRRANDGWSADDWQVFFDERASIAEYDGGLPRAEAEARAFACCVTEWINRYPTPSAPGRCLACGGGERSCDPLLPFGIELSATPGCIAHVGRRGIGREGSRLLRHLPLWTFERDYRR